MMSIALLDVDKIKVGGSVQGKMANIDLDYQGSHCRYILKYFWSSDMPLPGTRLFGLQQPDSTLETSFGILRSVLNRIFTDVSKSSEYFKKELKPDITGRLVISLICEVLCGIHEMSYETTADFSDDLIDVSESVASLCLEYFLKTLAEGFGE